MYMNFWDWWTPFPSLRLLLPNSDPHPECDVLVRASGSNTSSSRHKLVPAPQPSFKKILWICYMWMIMYWNNMEGVHKMQREWRSMMLGLPDFCRPICKKEWSAIKKYDEKKNWQRNLPLLLGSKQDLTPLSLDLKNAFIINRLVPLFKMKKISFSLSSLRFE